MSSLNLNLSLQPWWMMMMEWDRRESENVTTGIMCVKPTCDHCWTFVTYLIKSVTNWENIQPREKNTLNGCILNILKSFMCGENVLSHPSNSVDWPSRCLSQGSEVSGSESTSLWTLETDIATGRHQSNSSCGEHFANSQEENSTVAFYVPPRVLWGRFAVIRRR